MNSVKKFTAEFVGTLTLVLFGCGAAVTANTLVARTGILGGSGSALAVTTLLISFAFGLSIVAMAYSVGNVSGCHINPAVSLGMLINGKMSFGDFAGYVVSQLLGATAGAGILAGIFGDGAIATGLGKNGFGDASALGTDMVGALIVEIILTAVFVFVILGVTSKKEYSSVSGIVIGLTLTLIHILGIPFTGTSVNPARSIGPAVVLAIGGDTTALSQVWVFIAGPLIGAVIASALFIFLKEKGKNE